MKTTIEVMHPEDLAFCAEQAKLEGWNPGLHDMDVFYETDPSGWFKAVDEQGRMIGSISAVACYCIGLPALPNTLTTVCTTDIVLPGGCVRNQVHSSNI